MLYKLKNHYMPTDTHSVTINYLSAGVVRIAVKDVFTRQTIEESSETTAEMARKMFDKIVGCLNNQEEMIDIDRIFTATMKEECIRPQERFS